MTLGKLKEHLALAERHVREGERLVMRQLACIQGLAARGYETSDAEGLLRQLREVQIIYVADRDRLKKEIAQASF